MPTALETPEQASEPRSQRSDTEFVRSAPAGAVSVVAHALLLLVLAFVSTTGLNKPAAVQIDTRIYQNRDVPEFNVILPDLTVPTTDLSKLVPAPTAAASGGAGGSGGGGAGGSMTGGAAPRVNESLIPDVKVALQPGMGDLPGRSELDTNVRIHGEPTAVVADNSAVVDWLTREILRMLSERKVLVIWLFDESLSMKDDQQDIRNRFQKIYDELKLFGQTKGDALLTSVLSYGKDLHVQTGEPTSDLDKIRDAVDNIPIDPSGQEWPCKYVIKIAADYAKYFTQGRRTVCLVIVTDESGERAEGDRKESDGAYVEDAVAAAKKIKMPIYVIGRQAIFGYPYAHLTYNDPETGDTYWPVITRGPETPDVECLQTEALHGRWDQQSSGFGPYELVRLARDTGGIYFMLPEPDLQVPETRYDPLDMKEYLPEYAVRRDYIQHRDSSPFRRTVYQVIKDTAGIAVPLQFSVDTQILRRQAEDSYVQARKNRLMLAEAYKLLKDVERLRDKEPSQRWRAHYDLICGQVFAYQVKLYEYEFLLKDFVAKPPVPKFKPDAKYDVWWGIGHASHHTKSWAPEKDIKEPRELAEKLLQQVIERHPGTPWALRAQVELSRGFSVSIGEGRQSKLYGARAALVPKY